MNLGLIVRRDWTGLGVQTKDYYDHLKPKKTLVIDLSPYNGNPQNLDWYPNEPVVLGFPTKKQIQRFLSGLDVVLTAETPYNYELYSIAKTMGVRVANVINWEFFDHLVYPHYPLPDILIMPSTWHLEKAQQFAEEHNIKCVHIHHPVDRNKIKFRKRTTSKMFHIAGKPATQDRNGTWDFMRAVPDGRVATQSEDLAKQIRMRYRHSNVFTNIQDQNQLYSLGDVLVFPRKYGGNCLPLNEALSAGCPVIMPDVSPNNYLLPKEWLVPAKIVGSFTPREKIDIYQIDEQALQKKINWFKTEANIEEESEKASKIADSISWETLKSKYLEVLR